MPANTDPRFILTAAIDGEHSVIAANTTKDLTSGTSYLVFTAGAEGSFIETIRVVPKGTNVATAMRVWLNNGGVLTTADNNFLFTSDTIPASTASEVAGFNAIGIPVMCKLPANWRVYVTIGTAVAAGLQVTAFGGNY